MTEMYTCAVCGKSYEAIEDRVKCESKCVADRKRAEEEKKRNEYATKKRESEQAIDKALSSVNEMIAKHLKEYDQLYLKRSYPYLKYMFANTPWVF